MVYLWKNRFYILTLAGIIFLIVLFIYYPYLKTRYIEQNQTAVLGLNKSANEHEKKVANFLEIPSLGIASPINYSDEANEDKFQQLLQTGVVHYPGTAKVGEFGNTYIFGHSSDFPLAKGDYKTIFAKLPDVQVGAEILVSNQAGEVFKYVVQQKFVAEKTDTKLLNQGDLTQKQLTLQTSYPLGTALKRYIIIARIIP